MGHSVCSAVWPNTMRPAATRKARRQHIINWAMIAQERRDFDEAEKWYLKSLEITEKQGNEHGAASTYHQLGMIAQERRDFDEAEKWYLKSLEITEKQGNEHGAADDVPPIGQ